MLRPIRPLPKVLIYKRLLKKVLYINLKNSHKKIILNKNKKKKKKKKSTKKGKRPQEK
jgi:hypothetical protein